LNWHALSEAPRGRGERIRAHAGAVIWLLYSKAVLADPLIVRPVTRNFDDAVLFVTIRQSGLQPFVQPSVIVVPSIAVHAVSNLGGVAELPPIVDDPCTVKLALPLGTVKFNCEVHVQLPEGIVNDTVLALTELQAAETSDSEQDFATTCARQGDVGAYQNDKSSASGIFCSCLPSLRRR
jgi:hypothetical protein